jgi:hypothetical protein
VWLALLNRVQSADNLGRKKWKESKPFQLYQAEEIEDHLFFQCPGAVVRDSMRWGDVPKSVWDFKENFISSGRCRGVCAIWFMFGAICWTLCLNRNDFVFNNKLISSPRALIFCLISLMQHWTAMSIGADRAALERAMEETKAQVPGELVVRGVG